MPEWKNTWLLFRKEEIEDLLNGARKELIADLTVEEITVHVGLKEFWHKE